MIVSALLTSVGINVALCTVFFILYSILRQQPGIFDVYIPRLVAEGKAKQNSHFDIERLLPSPGWVRMAWRVSEEELLSASGLDAVVFIRIFIFSLKVFSVAGIIGICILLPINYFGDQLNDIDFSDLPNKSLDVFSISNVKNGSKWLWVHFCFAYIFTAVVCFLLYYEYKYISSKRIAYFYSSKPQAHDFTILVRGVPWSSESSISETVQNFFMEYHSSTYLSHTVVHKTSKLQALISDAEKVYKKIVRLKSKPGKQYQRDGFLGLFGQQVDLVDHFEKRLEDLEESVKIQQSDVSLTGEEVPAAFVFFNSRYGAAIATRIQQAINPTSWVTEQAPEPNDVYWPFLSASFMHIWISRLAVIIATIVLTILFLIPVVFVQGLTNLDQLEIFLPFLKSVLTITFISEVITGYLPSVILQLFLFFVPPVMKLFSSMQGFVSYSQIEKSACGKVLWFTIWNIFFANALSGSVYYQISVFLDPKNIPSKLAVAVPAQASFFIAYVVTGWTGLASELARAIPLIFGSIGRFICKCNGDEFQPPHIPYHKDIPKLLFFGLLGITYFLLAPLIVPFILGYYCLGYIVYRNQLLNVYLPKYETGGQFWPIVHNSMIFSLILMQAIAIGIFGLKELALASSLTVPLPVLTLLFNQYCRKRFLPIFKAYSAESLVKKDQADHRDPMMDHFFDDLVNEYCDPTMQPIKFSEETSTHTLPLLHSVVSDTSGNFSHR